MSLAGGKLKPHPLHPVPVNPGDSSGSSGGLDCQPSRLDAMMEEVFAGPAMDNFGEKIGYVSAEFGTVYVNGIVHRHLNSESELGHVRAVVRNWVVEITLEALAGITPADGDQVVICTDGVTKTWDVVGEPENDAICWSCNIHRSEQLEQTASKYRELTGA